MMILKIKKKVAKTIMPKHYKNNWIAIRDQHNKSTWTQTTGITKELCLINYKKMNLH
jgi:hypothetical protein